MWASYEYGTPGINILQRRLKHVLNITGQTGQGRRPEDASFVAHPGRGEGAPLKKRCLTAKGVAANIISSGGRRLMVTGESIKE